ncbi:nucleotide exchange factor GrpE [Pseudomonas sp. MYb185]|uniref:nucleotide exchange factor GrpE n=1 Tax=Pseudomonas sp. MYb185 TaxID=1848729 RepID=UPI000CFB12E5|nr:nucleotide exchange factor GrpE [Pseudomonas sp. MYb185]PRB79885.1 nucleotide exchange factor GrpE [Pseudomonas sp. MYb185]
MVDEQRQDLQDEEAIAEQEQAAATQEEELLARIADLEEQLAVAQDQALRAAADVQNARRRAEQEVTKAHKFALERFANDLLAVVDSLERGLELSSDEDPAIKPMRDGMELTLKLFADTLERYQVVAVDPHGEPFNPDLHQAMTMEERDNVEPNTVIKVFQKGYTINERLLRPAMVVVSKAGAGQSGGSINEQA